MIKRTDGTIVGRSAAEIRQDKDERNAQLASKRPTKVAIAALVPYEASVIAPNLSRAREAREAGTVDPPRVVAVGDRMLVLDGTHRVRAALDAGDTEIVVSLESCRGKDRERFEKTIALRTAGAGMTLKDLPVDATAEKRDDRTAQELRAIGSG